MFRLANTVEFRISKLQLRMRFAKNILHLSYLLHFIIFVFGVVCVYWNHPQLYLFICCAFAAFALKFIAKSVSFFLFFYLPCNIAISFGVVFELRKQLVFS